MPFSRFLGLVPKQDVSAAKIIELLADMKIENRYPSIPHVNLIILLKNLFEHPGLKSLIAEIDSSAKIANKPLTNELISILISTLFQKEVLPSTAFGILPGDISSESIHFIDDVCMLNFREKQLTLTKTDDPKKENLKSKVREIILEPEAIEIASPSESKKDSPAEEELPSPDHGFSTGYELMDVSLEPLETLIPLPSSPKTASSWLDLIPFAVFKTRARTYPDAEVAPGLNTKNRL